MNHVANSAAGIAFAASCLLGPAASAAPMTLCDQTIDAQIAPAAADVPANVRAFQGVWVGMWDGKLCSALVIEQVAANGIASGRYVWGTFGGWNVYKGSRAFRGTVAGNQLQERSNVTMTFTGPSGADLSGTFESSAGKFPGRFKRQ